jgi:hypothetical protein
MKDPRLRYLLPLGLWLADTWDNGAGPDDQATRHQLVPGGRRDYADAATTGLLKQRADAAAIRSSRRRLSVVVRIPNWDLRSLRLTDAATDWVKLRIFREFSELGGRLA